MPIGRQGPIVVTLKKLGHIPSIKNSMFRIVDPAIRDWKRRAVQHIASQLFFCCQTNEDGTPTTDSLQSLIASLPQDDSFKFIEEIRVLQKQVSPGEEGALIIIEKVDECQIGIK